MRRFDLQPCHTHCVFRRGLHWFALPAVSVREVLLRPTIIAVPNSALVLAGICHIRSEFLPVLNLDPFLRAEEISGIPVESQMIVVMTAEGSWGLLVDHVVELTSLETSVAPEGNGPSWFAAVLGWAGYRDQVARVLEPNVFGRLAATALESEWAGQRGEYQVGLQPSLLLGPNQNESRGAGSAGSDEEPVSLRVGSR